MKEEYDIRSLSQVDSFTDGELRAISDGKGTVGIRGYAAKFNERSRDLGGFREIILPGAFDDVLADKNTDVRALINHEGVPLARYRGGRDKNTLKLEIDGTGLRYEFRLDLSAESNRALASAMSRGDIDQSSFRFRAVDGSKWKEGEGGEMLREIFRFSSLQDVSIVTFPAYEATSAEVKRSLDAARQELAESPEVEACRQAQADAARAEADLAELATHD